MFQTEYRREENKVVLWFRETRKGPLPFMKKIEEHTLRDWSANSGASGVLAHAELSQLAETYPEQVIENDRHLILDDKVLARLSANALKSLGLPANPSLTFRLEQSGSLRSGNLAIQPWWMDGGQKIRTRRDGVFLTYKGKTYVIPDPIFEILGHIDAYESGTSSKDVADQMEMVAKVLELVTPKDPSSDSLDAQTHDLPANLENDNPDALSIKLDKALSRFRVKTARAISFDVTFRNEHGYHIKPVLFGKVPETGQNAASEKQGLLTPKERLIFESDPKKGFFSNQAAKRTYLLESGEYVLIDNSLFPALEHVRSMQTAGPEVRERFATNPAAVISEIYRERLLADGLDALPNDIQQEEIERILSSIIVETKEFSDRVTELGLWTPPVVPWVKRQPNSWEPEEFGIYLEGEFIILPPEDLPGLRKKIDEAIENGEKTVRYQERDIPANEVVKNTLDQLKGMIRPTPKPQERDTDGEDEGKEDKPLNAGPQVLLIKDNFDELKYTRELFERRLYTDKSPPSIIRSTLMEHQTVSFEWQVDAYLSGLPGVLNADDQGLGKTLQTLSFMAWLQSNMRRAPAAEKKPILVVAPTTLLKNWTTEVEKHMDDQFGLGSRIDAYGDELKSLKKTAGDGATYLDLGLSTEDGDNRICWVLTTYQTLAQNQVEFAKINFAVVVYDEIQNIKNVTTLAHRAAQSMRADFTVGLTGTPVENNIAELWAIMDTIAPGALGSLKDFMARFKSGDKKLYKELHDDIFGDGYSGTKDGVATPHIGMRRMKSETVKDLPLKEYRLYPTDMPQTQASAYDKVFYKLKNHTHGRALKILHQLRTVSLYPDNLQLLHNQPDALKTMKANSARIKATVDILDDIRKKHEKVLLFTETHEMQHLLRQLLRKRYGLDDIPILNGQTTPKRRGEIVDDFKKTRDDGHFDIRILAPKAAGVGITMIAATHIIHLSRWWNPAVEEQCNDRIYRIGQERDCTIHIPIAVHPCYKEATFDCILNDIMSEKRKLFRDVLMPSEDREADQGEMIARMNSETFDLQEIDLLNWKAFEEWGGDRAKETGVWEISTTPRIGDGGADVHLKHCERGNIVLVQCKHTGDHDKYMGASPVRQVLHSATRYDVSKGHQCVVLTNAQGFNEKARRLAKEENVILVDRHRLSLWPKHILLT